MTEVAAKTDRPRRTLEAYFAALTSLDSSRIASVFALDGEIEDPVGTPVRRGRDEVAAYFASGLCSAVSRVEIEIVAALPAGESIAAHWRMTAHAAGGATAEAEGIDVLQVGEDGLIQRAEGYWDQQAFRAALAGG